MHVQVVQEWEARVGDLLSTWFAMVVPPQSTPSFTTLLISLRWVLALRAVAVDAVTGDEETLQWQVPLLVTPATCP